MPAPLSIPALVAQGGAGARGAAGDRPERKRGMMAAIRRGADILRDGGSALDAVVATVVALEDHPLFNAGYGSLLNSEGAVEMDASVMAAVPLDPSLNGRRSSRARFKVSAGAVAAVSRIRNPILLARAVKERSPHMLMAASGAERFAKSIGMKLCRPEELITERARERWHARQAQQIAERGLVLAGHGTVGAVAIDSRGGFASATSTGGVPGKLAGRVGDSAIIGAGTYASGFGAASATGHGEAIIATALCREAALSLQSGVAPEVASKRAIVNLIEPVSAEAGIILVDRRGRVGFAHNATAMQVSTFDLRGGIRHFWVAPISHPRAS